MTAQEPRSASRRRRLTIRARLCASYAGLVSVCGIVFIALLYLYMRYVPSYDLQVRQAPELDPSASPDAASGPTEPTGFGTAQPLEIRSADDFLENLLIASAIALGILIVLGAVLGWVMAGRIIEPIAAINTAANRAANGDLDHRIHMDGPRDEIRDLSETFDRMLASLEHSFQAQRRFAANASHELRSPLTTVKTMIDVTLADPDAEACELRALAERIRDVNQSHIDTVEALLNLASASNALLAPEPVDLTPLIDEVMTELADEIEAKDLTVTVETAGARTLGNAILLRQAISNLLRNAARHNHAGGTIAIATSTGADRTRLTITNTGAVVDGDTLDQLTEPFARGNGRTVTRGTGHGLGLAIVAAIAHAHEGTLTLEANPGGGLIARLDLPR
ncbi:sensor histidine kinase [Ruania rhizosphaerae]|uniref:sensor histidine kinase n=1 Tax=Ruania rhizosphaerae TaxID=1840413 RepID=UPI00135A6E8C|nr:HAMP domain-containing sensor histidine kinase [Ruania rhizosphaerae]